MNEKLPEHVFHQFDYMFDKMDGAHFGEAEIVGILYRAKNDGIYPGAAPAFGLWALKGSPELAIYHDKGVRKCIIF